MSKILSAAFFLLVFSFLLNRHYYFSLTVVLILDVIYSNSDITHNVPKLTRFASFWLIQLTCISSFAMLSIKNILVPAIVSFRRISTFSKFHNYCRTISFFFFLSLFFSSAKSSTNFFLCFLLFRFFSTLQP